MHKSIIICHIFEKTGKIGKFFCEQ